MPLPSSGSQLDCRRLCRWTSTAALGSLGPGAALTMSETWVNGGLALLVLGLLLSVFAVAFQS